jgi:hypothetical protein
LGLLTGQARESSGTQRMLLDHSIHKHYGAMHAEISSWAMALWNPSALLRLIITGARRVVKDGT